MKEFLGTFAVCAIFFYLCFFFGGWMIFDNITALVVVLALFTSCIITGFIRQSERISRLEKRVAELENPQQ